MGCPKEFSARFFFLDEFLLPLQCADPTYFYDKFECQNPEHDSKGLVATQLHLQVDSRFTGYAGCNFCTGTDPFTQSLSRLRMPLKVARKAL